MDVDYSGSYDIGNFYDTGSFDVKCNPILYGVEQITLDYRMYSKFHPEDLVRILSFIQENYRQAYDHVLTNVLSVYKRNPKWDVWMEETKEFLRIDFTVEQELHTYIGLPIIELARYNGRSFWGMTFSGEANKLSLEHGFCTVFEQEKLLVLADNDFPLVLKWWDYYSTNGNILTTSSV